MLEAECLGPRAGRASAAGWRTAMTNRDSMQALGAGLWLLTYSLTNLGRSESSLGNGWKVSPAAPFMRNGVWSCGGGVLVPPRNRDQPKRMAGCMRPAFSQSARAADALGRQPPAVSGVLGPSAFASGSVAGKKSSAWKDSPRSHIRHRAVRILRWVLRRAWRTSWVRSRLWR